jgi:5-methylcytosine-specific restriction endonuclease McrA
MRNARPPRFRAPWLPSRAASLAAFRQEQRRWNPQPPAAARGYDPAWSALRAQHLAVEPNCRKCALRGVETSARIVDHVVPVRVAPERRLDPTNLQSLCWPCHNAKTQREVRARR